MSSFAVLHITSVPGGGVDRHVRDIARGSRHAQLSWHAAANVDVMESPAESRYIALDSAALDRAPAPLAAWLRERRVGLVHAHAIAEPVCARTRWAAGALGVRYVATLHDILFLRPDAFEAPEAPPDPAWLARTGDFLRGAAAVVAPSEYLAGRAREALPGLDVSVIPNSSPPAAAGKRVAARAEFIAHRPAHVAAMIGAIGPHKGSEMLERLADALEGSDIAIVVIGYLDRQVHPGWRGRHVFVHGAYDDDQVAPLLAAYGAEIALFPNQVPESFSYTLSDAWIAGVPALVAPSGALAERVGRHAGGWLLPRGFGAVEIAAALRRLLGPGGEAQRARVKSQLASADPARVPSPEQMTRSLDALYERYGIDPGAPPPGDSPQLAQLIAKNVNGALFRQELVRLADEMVQMRESLEALDRARLAAGQSAEDARRWGEKLQADVASLQEEVRREVEARRAAADENAQLQRHKRALEVLPRWLRRVLMKISDGRS